MFQNYVHAGSIDPNLPFVEDFVPGTSLFVYSPVKGGSGATFVGTFEASAYFGIAAINLAPVNSLLVYNIGREMPGGLVSGYVEFTDGLTPLARFPLDSNGLNLVQGAVPIPDGAITANIILHGFEGVALGQVRVCDREVIPYQPLKG